MARSKTDVSDGEIYAAVSRRADPDGHDRLDAMLDRLFDGSDPDLIERERALFEVDADEYGFDLRRQQCAAPEPWSEYADPATGHRWAGWLAACGTRSNA